MHALQSVGRLIAQGQVVPAARLLMQAADKGDRDAIYELALWRFSGALIRRDLVEARHLLLKAADGGHPDAERDLIAFLANGTGGERDWKGALARLRARAATDQGARAELRIIGAMDLDQDGDPRGTPPIEQLSKQPFVAVVRGCLSTSEARYLIDMAAPLFEPAAVFDPATGRPITNIERTSDHACFPLIAETPAMHALNRRLGVISRTRPEQGEPLQILRYRVGQEYRLHSDAFPASIPNQRIKTVLVWLNDDYEGGQTCFPSAELSVRGRTGDALVFENVDANGGPDPRALHSGEPVTRGSKYLASRWIRARPLDLTGPPGRPL